MLIAPQRLPILLTCSWFAHALLCCHLATADQTAGGVPTWTMARGDSGATGSVGRPLPPDLQVLWERKLSEAIETTPVSDGLRVYVTDVMGGLEALDLASGEPVWRRDFDTGFVAAPAIYVPPQFAEEQKLVVAPMPSVSVESIENNVESIENSSTKANDDSSGASDENPAKNPTKPNQEPDTRETPDSLGGVPSLTSAPAVLTTDLILVVGDVEGNIYALRAEDGATLWTQTTDGEINASPSFFQVRVGPEATNDQITDDQIRNDVSETRVLQTSQDGSLYCFVLATGQLRWKYETGDQIRCAVSIGEGQTYLGGCDAGLHVVDLATGRAAREPLSLDGPTGSTPAIIGDDVIVPIMDGVLYSFDPEAGTTRWKYEDSERVQDYRGSVAVNRDYVIIASRNKHVEAINRSTGKPVWRTTLRRRADASPLIVGDDVWIASTAGRLMRLSLTDGTEIWSYEIKGAFYASPAILGDRLIIADDEGVVRCLGPGRNS